MTTQTQHHNVVTLDADNFEQEVLQGDQVVLVDFGAEWCPPCKAIAPIIEEIATEYEGVARVGTVATVRLELDNWTGQRFTDLFTLLKIDGEWKIMNKVFHLHT